MSSPSRPLYPFHPLPDHPVFADFVILIAKYQRLCRCVLGFFF